MRITLAATTVLVLACCCGCPPVTPSGTDLPYLDEDGNASFDSATALALQPTDELNYRGEIETSADIDIYDLGTLSPGDQLFVDVQATSGNLDAVAAVFDAREYIHAFNDDRSQSPSDLNPQIDVVIRGPAGSYFLGIVAYEGSLTRGQYEVTVRVTRGVGIPTAAAQIVFLDWNGGQSITIPNVGTYNLDPFDATDVGLPTAQTGLLKDRVQQIILDRYDGFNFVLRNSDDHAVPSGAHSTVYFGGSNARAFAIAEQIDTMNADLSDDAIVFTEEYDDAFLGSPSFEQMAQALGNTVAHEVGHLLGLLHTVDCSSLMDSSCSNNSILRAQNFKLASLADGVFPLGVQNAPELLGWILGIVGL